LSNLAAGGGGQRAERIKEFLRDHPDVPHVEPGGSGGIGEALHHLAERGVDVLAVSGGDGTLQRALTELLANGQIFPALPLVAPLRAGSTNMSALDIGSDRSPARALEKLRQSTRDNSIRGQVVERPVLRVALGDDSAPQYGMFCGIGTIHRAIELTHRVFPHGRTKGVFGSGLVTSLLLLRHILGKKDGLLDPDNVAIELDGTRVAADRFRFVMATTLDRLFLNMRPFWGRERAPIRFTALEPDGRNAFKNVIKVLRGLEPVDERGAVESGYTSHNVFTTELTLDCGLTIDGELFEPRPGRTITLSADERLRFVQT
jgi:diacylglycerol kinase (ATP)